MKDLHQRVGWPEPKYTLICKKKGATMLLIIPLVLLLVLKLANIWIFAGLSWWWIIGLAVFAFLWFEIFERILGLDKRKDDAYFEKMKQERIKRTFSKKNKASHL